MKTIPIKNIDRMLNLAKSTVSRALRDSPEISVDTKKRTLDKRLNYNPNPLALSLIISQH